MGAPTDALAMLQELARQAGNDPEGALLRCRQILARRPDNLPVLCLAAGLQRRAGRLDDAAAMLDRAARVDGTAAPVLAVEVDMGDPANLQKSAVLVMQKGMLPGDTTLEDRLSPELWQRMQDFAAESNMPLGMYSKFTPGIVAMMMVLEEYKKVGFDPELGIDKHFLDAAGEYQHPCLLQL